MNYYADKDIKTLLLINPDNPSGNYIPKKMCCCWQRGQKKEKSASLWMNLLWTLRMRLTVLFWNRQF